MNRGGNVKAKGNLIIGFDASTRLVGWAVLDIEGSLEPRHVASGVIEGKGGTLFGRYRSIRFKAREILQKYEGLTSAAFEDGIIFKASGDPDKASKANPHTALAQAEVRGILIGLVIDRDLPFQKYMPSTVKKAATGNGRSKKFHVEDCVVRRFGLAYASPDQADAIAVALAHAYRLEEERLKLVPPDPMAGTFWASREAAIGEGN